MRYLGIEPARPRVAVFDFTGCEGCELQLANREDSLPEFLAAIDLVAFREVSSQAGDDYQIALVEGAVTRADEVARLEAIRARAELVVALGSCACFGGVNQLKNGRDLAAVHREVYGEVAAPSGPARPIREVIGVDLEIPGCPVSKAEVERLVQHLQWQIPFRFPAYPVCVECKQRFTVCAFDLGQLCLGPITRAGCGAPCPAGGAGCWGCRGAAEQPNIDELFAIARRRGFTEREIRERMEFFGGFAGVTGGPDEGAS